MFDAFNTYWGNKGDDIGWAKSFTVEMKRARAQTVENILPLFRCCHHIYEKNPELKEEPGRVANADEVGHHPCEVFVVGRCHIDFWCSL